MSNLILNYKVEEQQLLRDFLYSKGISKKTLTRIKYDNDGSIKVNGCEQNVRYLLNAGDTVSLTLPKEQFSDNVRFINKKINIVYEDDFILIVNKPSDLPTIPSRNLEDESLLEYVNYYFKDREYAGIPHIVTRLDKDTSGLVIIAKHRHVHALLSKTNIDKFYLALAHGRCPEHTIIEKNIARAEDSIIERVVRDDGDYAKTEVWCEKYYEESDISLLKLKLYTGRTHQIRVHCASIGHSLLGDELYGGNRERIGRQALHCRRLKFNHPFEEKILEVVADIPEDMAKIIKNGS